MSQAVVKPRTERAAAPTHCVVERLQGLLSNEAELISAIAEKLVAAWRGKLGDVRTDAASAAPQLTDLDLTLHRLGGASRQSGIALFEPMIEIDAYGEKETQAEIDGTFGPRRAKARQRIHRPRTGREQAPRAG